MSRQKSLRWFKRLLLLAFLAGGVACGTWFYRRQFVADAPHYETSPVIRGELLQAITASGQLNPVTMVEVGSQISGIIQQLRVDFNSMVTKGQVIARIDPATYEANSLQAEGNLANARAALELAQLEERRALVLRTNKLNAQSEYDTALAALHQAEANVKIKEGALKSAQVDLARCTIYSPIDGLVLSRDVNVGQTVAASLSAPRLFVIANDLTKMQIEANVAEADIGLVELGQEAEFNVDAFPGQTFHGKVKQIRNAPKTDQSVVTYATIVEVSNPDLKLKPGMTANVSIIVARREQALKIANAALRFHPPARAEAAKTGAAPSHKKDQRKSDWVVYLLACQAGATNLPAGAGQAAVLEPVTIKTGINNAAFTEVVAGLKEGDEVVSGLASSKAPSLHKFNPFASGVRH